MEVIHNTQRFRYDPVSCFYFSSILNWFLYFFCIWLKPWIINFYRYWRDPNRFINFETFKMKHFVEICCNINVSLESAREALPIPSNMCLIGAIWILKQPYMTSLVTQADRRVASELLVRSKLCILLQAY